MIAAIACVKNELDIIEPWVRHTLSRCERLLVTDGSVDGTREVLAVLELEFMPRLGVVRDKGIGDRQSERMTWLLHQAYNQWKPDYIVPLDADEFIDGDMGDLSLIPPGQCGLVPWRTYVSGELCADPPRSITWRRKEEKPPYWKAILNTQGVDISKLTIPIGNHSMVCNSQPLPTVDLPDLRLLHYPVRSREQIVGKTVVGWPCLLMSRMEKRDGGAAYQRQALFDLIASGGQLDVMEQARMYAQSERAEIIQDAREWEYERKYTNGQPMSAIQLIARSWEEAVK